MLSGHVHNYQRTCSVFKKTCVPPAADGANQAPVWVVNGNAGQWLSTALPVIPPFFEVVAIEHGYLRYHVNRSSLFAEVWGTLIHTNLYVVSTVHGYLGCINSLVLSAEGMGTLNDPMGL